MEKEIRTDYMAGETFVEPVKSDPEAEKRRIVDYFIRLRKEKGLTQQDLADTSGICRANVARFERGDYNPTLETMIRMAEAMGKTLEVSFKDKE